MSRVIARISAIALLATTLGCITGVASANMTAGSNDLQGAAYLTAAGNSPSQSVPGTGFTDNGVAGTRAVLRSVPEPSSIAMFAGALALLGAACVLRNRRRED